MSGTDAGGAGREMDAAVALALGIPKREIPPGLDRYGALDPNSPLWEDIMRRAIASGVVLKQTGTYKGTRYAAVFDGWELSYTVHDNYRASETVTLDGEPSRWCGYDDEVFVSPAVPPHYSTDPAAAWQVVEHVSRERKVWFGVSYAHPALADTGMEHESCSVMVHPIGSIKPLADATAATFAEAVCRCVLALAGEQR